MRDLVSAPIVYLLIVDEAAVFKLDSKYVYQIAAEQVRKSEFAPKIKVFCVQKIFEKFKDNLISDFEFTVDTDLISFIKNLKIESEILIFHNTARPLVPARIYDQGIKMLLQGVDAVKQQHVVVDTLKQTNDNKFVLGTINRDSVKAITTPEFYWTENILTVSEDFGWFYKMQNESNKEYIFGELESSRIRSKRDLFLVKALLDQKAIN